MSKTTKFLFALVLCLTCAVAPAFAAPRPDGKQSVYFQSGRAGANSVQDLGIVGREAANIYDLTQGDVAISVEPGGMYTYIFDASGTDAHDGLDVIRPLDYDANAPGVWLRVAEFTELDPIFSASAAFGITDAGSGVVISAGERTHLGTIESGAQVNPDLVTQQEAEVGTGTAERTWTPQRVAQAILALAPTGTYLDATTLASLATGLAAGTLARTSTVYVVIDGTSYKTTVASFLGLIEAGDIPDLSAVYLTPAAGNAAYAELGHNHTGTYLEAETDPTIGTLTAGKWCTSDGSLITCTEDAPAGAGHDAVTLQAALDTNLLSLSGQELQLDTRAANTVFAGPVEGAVAAPAFRALVVDDIPDLSALYGGGGTGEVSIFGTPTTGQYARWTAADTIEGRTAEQARGDLGLGAADEVAFGSVIMGASVLDCLAAAPATPVEGMTACADGVGWQPGSTDQGTDDWLVRYCTACGEGGAPAWVGIYNVTDGALILTEFAFDATADHDLTGTVTATTQAAGDDTTKLATTAFVQAALYAAGVPTIAITTPATDGTWESSATYTGLAGTAASASGIAAIEWKLESGGTYAATGVTGTTSWVVDSIGLAEGLNTIYARVTATSSGMVKETTRTINLDTTAPVIDLSADDEV